MKKIYFLLLISILTLPFFAFGDVYEYTPLVTIPGSGVEANQPVNLGAYLNGIYRILIAITIILAVIVITISGIQHMASESPFSKSEASKRIGGAIGGIVLAVMSWLILFTINPCLVSFNFLTPTAACGGPNKPTTNIRSLSIVNTKIPANTGLPILSKITAVGGSGPYQYLLVGGSLPPGTSLNSSTGELNGTPGQTGNYTFTIEVIDSVGEKSTQSITVEVMKFTGFLTVSGGEISIPAGTTEVFEGILVTGGIPPYSYSITAGSLPGGLTLNNTTGKISGQPPEPGQYIGVAEVTVGDTTGQATTIDINITVAQQNQQINFTGKFCYTFPNEPGLTKPKFCFNSHDECTTKKNTETKPTSSCFEEIQ